MIPLKSGYVYGSGYEIETTNNRMELKAVCSALNDMLKARHSHESTELAKVSAGCELVIFSDSAYVVNAINNNWVVSWMLNGWRTKSNDEVKNKDLWEDLWNTLGVLKCFGLSVVFQKIKGHSGDPMNELADKIARSKSIEARSTIGKR